MITPYTVPWSAIKSLSARGVKLYWTAGDAVSKSYDVYTTNHRDFFLCSVSGTGDQDSGKEFESSYKVAGYEVESFGHFLALAPPPVNAFGAQLVQTTARISQLRSLTIVTHDFSEPCTWWQRSTQVTNEELEHEGAGVFASDHPLWINVEHPKVFADESLDVAAWAGAGYPGDTGPFYRSWWMPDASARFRNHYYPVVQVQPGGTGDWVTKAPEDATYGHTFDYVLGKIHFPGQGNWAGGTKVRATYFYAEETHDGALFEIGPPEGKVWHLTRTEVQLTVGASWQDTIRFYGKQGGIVGTRARYKSYGNMQSTATSQGSVILNGGIAEEGQAWPASADNGWMHGGCSGLRNLTRPVEIDPWDYKKPFELVYGMTIGVSLAEGKKFLTADIANVTFYVDEYNA